MVIPLFTELTLRWRTLWAYFFLAGVSYGVLDAFTNGGSALPSLRHSTGFVTSFPLYPISVMLLEPANVLGPAGMAVWQAKPRGSGFPACWAWADGGGSVGDEREMRSNSSG